MEPTAISEYADWLESHVDDIVSKRAALDEQKVYAIVDALKVLPEPVQTYLTMSQEKYYEDGSSHDLDLDGGSAPVSEVHDRLMVNHVDGVLPENTVHFTYNHEDVYQDGYAPRRDCQIMMYALEVLGAVAGVHGFDLFAENVKADAVVSIALSAKTIADWQQTN
ncbi:hypothetical protein [Schleiferilactobacillus perolens]|jgi:hypothetical protein|uniref:Uncharacterized protein n=1 Tax=Schleiferilactobacillus perolens DSM 12744 TaxID=1423792 RepID=A0A0R1MWE9_9LACO|nr:hypothetical protein [Schleiferilactobacillus perolens]KRL12519.1 hypothetical protein FD09_GL002836 [Schleiferilactobacillus perolens DSM 12744]MCI1890922.1 hypothetical protein [Schleiferilactobacillus harbinensis]MCI1911527.1 hypothetical protein [Schleiferilactobacillus harbinensis]MCI2171125.1 hypothetical protein [Schleiferilactobacillus perolens]